MPQLQDILAITLEGLTVILEVEWSTLGFFILATMALIASPGPIVSLIIAETLTYSGWHGFAVSLGAGTMAIVTIVLVFAGLGTAATQFEASFTYIQYGGAAFLILLAIQAWRREGNQGKFGENAGAATPLTAFKKSLVVSALSPKALLFFFAFFPQFIEPGRAVLPQFLLLGILFLMVSISMDGLWILGARKARNWLHSRGARRTVNRISATFLAVGAVVLVLLN